MNKNSSCLLG